LQQTATNKKKVLEKNYFVAQTTLVKIKVKFFGFWSKISLKNISGKQNL
jgi:hypothetical protein